MIAMQSANGGKVAAVRDGVVAAAWVFEFPLFFRAMQRGVVDCEG